MKILLLVLCLHLASPLEDNQLKPFRTRAEQIKHAKEHRRLSIEEFKKRIGKGQMAEDMERTAEFMQRMRDRAEKHKNVVQQISEEEKNISAEINNLMENRVEMIPSILEVNEDFEEHLYQGDIVLTAEDIALMEKETSEPGSRFKRAGLFDSPFKLWPKDEVIHYGYGPEGSYSQEDIDWFKQSMDDISNNTCIKAQMKTEGFREVMKQSGCSSAIGWPGSGYTREISIGNNCGWSVQHEMFHTLGLSHTQSRNDRDNFVTFRSDYYSYDKLTYEFQLDPPVSYDFKSVMQYPAHSHSPDGDITIIPIQADYVTTMGYRMAPSFSDWKQINLRYKCGDHCPPPLVQCENGGYPHPRTCNICVCTDFYDGSRCENYKGVVLLSGQSKVISNTGKYDSNLFNKHGSGWDFGKYTRFDGVAVTGPVGKKLKATLTKVHVRQSKCPIVCSYTYIEIVDNKAADLTMGGKMFCCDNRTSHSFISTTNVIGYRGWAAPGYEYDFKVTVEVYEDSPIVPSQCSEPAHCMNNGSPHPQVCGSCYCPVVSKPFRGKLCETEGNIYTLSSTPGYAEEIHRKVGHNYKTEEYANGEVLKADVNFAPHKTQKILVTIAEIQFSDDKFDANCKDGCRSAAFEFFDNDLEDMNSPGKLFCCREDQGKSFVTKGNFVGMRGFAGKGYTADIVYTVAIHNSTAKSP